MNLSYYSKIQNSPWILAEGTTNPSTTVVFTDYDDPTANNTLPFQIQLVNSPNFQLSGPTISSNNTYQLTYIGVLNRTMTKNLTATFQATDSQGFTELTTIQ